MTIIGYPNDKVNHKSFPTRKDFRSSEKCLNFTPQRLFSEKVNKNRNFVLVANRAQIAALQRNFSEKKNFLKKIGSNPLLWERVVFLEYKNSWKLLENSSAEDRGKAPSKEGNASFANWLGWKDSNLR